MLSPKTPNRVLTKPKNSTPPSLACATKFAAILNNAKWKNICTFLKQKMSSSLWNSCLQPMSKHFFIILFSILNKNSFEQTNRIELCPCNISQKVLVMGTASPKFHSSMPTRGNDSFILVGKYKLESQGRYR